MINLATGEVKLDGYRLIIHPDLTLSEFKLGDIPVSKITTSTSVSSTQCYFAGVNDGLRAEFVIAFVHEHLHGLYLARPEQKQMKHMAHLAYVAARKESLEKLLEANREWGPKIDQLQNEHKVLNDQWLLEVTGKAPPYIADWGRIVSCRDSRMDDDAMIVFQYKHYFLDRGFSDIPSWMQAQGKAWAEILQELQKEDAKR